MAQPPRQGTPAPVAPVDLQAITDGLARIRRQEQRLDRYVRRALAGADFSLGELVAMQSLVYRYAQQVEMLSRVVDRVTGAIKQTLRTQV